MLDAAVDRQSDWGFSSVGRAPALQAGCQRFESANLHQIELIYDSLRLDSRCRCRILSMLTSAADAIHLVKQIW